MKSIIDDINNGTIESALQWTIEHKTLFKSSTELHFTLVQLQFITLILQGDLKHALLFSKHHFHPFLPQYLTGTILVYYNPPKNSLINK